MLETIRIEEIADFQRRCGQLVEIEPGLPDYRLVGLKPGTRGRVKEVQEDGRYLVAWSLSPNDPLAFTRHMVQSVSPDHLVGVSPEIQVRDLQRLRGV